MMIRRKMALGLLAAVAAVSAMADCRIDCSKVYKLFGVSVTNIIVNGVSRNTESTLYSVPSGSEVILALGDSTGLMWGTNNLVRLPSVVTDVTITELPEGVRAYRATVDDPVQLRDYDDLLELKRRVNAGRSFTQMYFRQVADIDLAGLPAWSPIGSKSVPFSGIYDGGGHRLDNLTLEAQQYSGFFGCLSYGAISNLTVSIAGIDGTAATVGVGFVGICSIDFTLEHIVTEGQMTGVTSTAGGLAAYAHRGTIIGCTNRVDITGCADKMGGLVGTSRAVSGTSLKGVTYIDCANEGNLTATKVSSKIGGSVGMGGISGEIYLEQVSTFIRCVNRGTLTPYSEKSRVGSILGRDAGGNSVAVGIDCEASADWLPIAYFTSVDKGLSGFYFATVNDNWAKFIAPPDTKGTYRVMLTNSCDLVLANVVAGDRLVLENHAAFKGTVSCADSAQSVSGENGVWTVSGGMAADGGTLTSGTEEGVYALEPTNGQVEVTITGFSGDVLQIPSTITWICGVEREKLQVLGGGHELTSALQFTGTAAEGYDIALDGTATVGGVKVTPTIGENVSDAFSVSNGVRLVVQSIPGLWYGLWRGTDPATNDELCAATQADEATVTLSDSAPPAACGFYRVGVTLQEPEATAK